MVAPPKARRSVAASLLTVWAVPDTNCEPPSSSACTVNDERSNMWPVAVAHRSMPFGATPWGVENSKVT